MLNIRAACCWFELHDSDVVCAAIWRHTTEFAHFFVGTGFQSDSFSVREIDQDLKALRWGNHEFVDRDGRGKKAAIGGYDVNARRSLKRRSKFWALAALSSRSRTKLAGTLATGAIAPLTIIVSPLAP